MKTEEERQEFLAGYCSAGGCDLKLINYYMVLIYARFLKFGGEAYEQYVREWILKAVRE